jgi:glycosyltransferase involved in cell wall biosynthesis
MQKMTLTIVLPKLFDQPIGGYKVHYQYANALAKRGHKVTLVHPITDHERVTARDRVLLLAAKFKQITSRRPPISWFTFDPKVRSVLILTLSGKLLPAADITVLTAWQTAELTAEPAARAGVLTQIVYDYEFWMCDPQVRQRMKASFRRSNVIHIATSRAVARMLREMGTEPIATICAGLAEGEFGVDAAINDRERVVVFPRRADVAKDLPTALAAASLIRDEYPEVRIECFGPQFSGTLPTGVKSLGPISNHELRALYNRASVFFLSSRYEGWGLPVMEAMACGAAIVSTRCGGVEDFVEDEVSGLLVPVHDARAIADAVVRLLRDEDTRARLAIRGSRDIVLLTVSQSCERLEQVLRSLLVSPPAPKG